MTPIQIKLLKLALVAGSELFLLGLVRYAMKSALYNWAEYKTLYDFQVLVIQKIAVDHPELFDDPDIERFIINYEFSHMVRHIQEEK